MVLEPMHMSQAGGEGVPSLEAERWAEMSGRREGLQLLRGYPSKEEEVGKNRA